MPNILIPQVDTTFELAEDWQVELAWDQCNLRMLAAFKLTGMKKTVVSQAVKYSEDGKPLRDSQGKYVFEPIYQNRTVANPIFQDYEGNSTPALVTFVRGTQFLITRISTGRKGYIHGYHLKCVASTARGVKGKCMQLSLRHISGAPVIHA